MIGGNKITKETVWAFATKFSVFPFYLLINVFLARTLGEDRWGEWIYFFSFFNVLYLLSLFGVRASQKYAAEYKGTSRLSAFLNDALGLRTKLNILFALLLVGLSFIIPPVIGKPEFAILFQISALLIFVSGYLELFKGLFTGLHEIRSIFFLSSIEFSLKLLFIVLFVGAASALSWILIAYLVGVVIATLLGFVLIRKWRENKKKKPEYVNAIVSYSIPLLFISIGFSVATEIDTIMLGMMREDEVGDYGIAKQLVVKLPHLAYALAMGSMALFAKINSENLQQRKKLLKRLLALNAVIFIPLCLLIITLASFFVPRLYGAEFVGAVIPLQVLTIYILIFSFSVFFNQLLDYQHRASFRAKNLFFSLVLNLVLNLVLIPEYGAVGAAISTAIAYLPYLFLNAWESYRLFKEYEQVK